MPKEASASGEGRRAGDVNSMRPLGLGGQD